jgi:HNH endonuclease
MDLTQERLKQLVEYDPDTGALRNRANGRSIGWRHSGGYRQCMMGRKKCFVHRLAWLYVHGVIPVEQIDHINGNRSDNRICNLRIATQKQNSANMKIRSSNKVGLKGVSRINRSKPFFASIHVDGKTKYLGIFATAEEAHEVYLAAAKMYFGDYARAE